MTGLSRALHRLRATVVRRGERLRGLDTADIVRLEDMGLTAADRVEYVPSGWRTLHRILPPDEVAPSDVFVDFGSGKGRIVLQAARYPFRRIEGVELAGPLHELARTNVERSRSRLRCSDITLVNSDVLDYRIPDDLTVAYFFNPFTGPLFAEVVDRLVRSQRRNPRRMRVIYVNPREDAVLRASGRARLVRTVHVGSAAETVNLYELPSPGPAS